MICGYDTDADEFEIRDPANSRYDPVSFSFVLLSFLKTSAIILIPTERNIFFLRSGHPLSLSF